jgi:hypothetical protein
MGWGRLKNGREWVPDERAGKASSPEEYHKMRFWRKHEAQN